MPQYRCIRIDTAFTNENLVDEFCNQKGNLAWVYCQEISKQSKKEHFHIVLKTDRHVDTITKDIKSMFNVNKIGSYSHSVCKDLKKAIAYTLKDGNYTVHWDNNEQIDEAIEYMNNIQISQSFNTLREEIIYHLNEIQDSEMMMNTRLMYEILKIFKTKQLKYPSQNWIKNCMITYYMQDLHKDMNMKNIESLYSIRDPYLKE